MRYKKSKGFSLIEVLVAVIILSSVATALFEISFNSKNNFVRYQKRINFETLASIPLFLQNNSNTNLYEQIKQNYKIKDDELRKILKETKLQKQVKQFSTIKITDDFALQIPQVQIYGKKGSTIYYGISIKQ